MDSPKCAPLYILPAESYMNAVFEEGTKGHVLSEGPVHLPILHQFSSTAQDTGHTWGPPTQKLNDLSMQA